MQTDVFTIFNVVRIFFMAAIAFFVTLFIRLDPRAPASHKIFLYFYLGTNLDIVHFYLRDLRVSALTFLCRLPFLRELLLVHSYE